MEIALLTLLLLALVMTLFMQLVSLFFEREILSRLFIIYLLTRFAEKDHLPPRARCSHTNPQNPQKEKLDRWTKEKCRAVIDQLKETDVGT